MAMTIRLAVNETKALRELAARLGYIATDGRFAGEGNINKMMVAIAGGELTVLTQVENERNQMDGMMWRNLCHALRLPWATPHESIVNMIDPTKGTSLT